MLFDVVFFLHKKKYYIIFVQHCTTKIGLVMNSSINISIPNGRRSYVITFSHPLLKDSQGRLKRIRRGLGTSDENEAINLKHELNEILSNQDYWNYDSLKEAEKRFKKIIVDAFYSYLEPDSATTWDKRNNIIELPDKNSGFSTLLLLGTTGSGKTTLLRQLIGTDPENERFPSTSTAKTTTSDYELICDPVISSYKAVATFHSRKKVEIYVQECISQACLSWIEAKNEKELIRKFFEHSEQRFRLKYLIGDYIENTKNEDVDNEGDTYENENIGDLNETGIEIEQNKSNIQSKLEDYLKKIKEVSEKLSNLTLSELDYPSFKKIEKKDKESFLELIEEKLNSDEIFIELTNDIIEEIESKFDSIKIGEFYKKFNWPEYWDFETNDRIEFIKSINFFSSNNSKLFGSLLTPLVDGVRVRGPFRPSIGEDIKMVFIDGEGLGHNPREETVLSTKLMNKFPISDAIILVDNAQQPMQSATISSLKYLNNSGNLDKLIIAFTHYDLLKGDNFSNDKDKQNHLLNSIDNAIKSIDSINGASFNNTIENNIFYFPKINERLDPENKLLNKQLLSFIISVSKKIVSKSIEEIKLIYSDESLSIYINNAIKEFIDLWNSRLGNNNYFNNVKKEHWTRIKALTRRLGEFNIDEYDNLKPVSELISSLIQSITKFLYNFRECDPESADDSQKQNIISNIQRSFSEQVNAFISKELHKNKLPDWFDAYSLRGKGSSFERAESILNIYRRTAPSEINFNEAEFYSKVKEMLVKSINDNNCIIT